MNRVLGLSWIARGQSVSLSHFETASGGLCTLYLGAVSTEPLTIRRRTNSHSLLHLTGGSAPIMVAFEEEVIEDTTRVVRWLE